MKKTIKFLGIIALVAVIGFTMAGCGDKGGDAATYTVFYNEDVTDTDAALLTKFGITMPTTDGPVAFATKSKAELLEACNADANFDKETGITYAEIEEGIGDMLMGPAKTTAENDIKNKGYVLFGFKYSYQGTSYKLICAAFKE